MSLVCCYHCYHSSSRIGSGLLAPLVMEMTVLNILFLVAAFSGADPELFVEFDGRRVSIEDATLRSRASVAATLQRAADEIKQHPDQQPRPRLPYRRLTQTQVPDRDPDALYQQYLNALLYSYLKFEVYQEFARQFPPTEFGVTIDAEARSRHLDLTSELNARQQEVWFDEDRPILSAAEAAKRMQKLYPGASPESAQAYTLGEFPDFSQSFVYRRMTGDAIPARSNQSPAPWMAWQQVNPLFFEHLKAVASRPHEAIERTLAVQHGEYRFFVVRHPGSIPDSAIQSLGDRLGDLPADDVPKTLAALNRRLRAARFETQVGTFAKQRALIASALDASLDEVKFQAVIHRAVEGIPVALYSPDSAPHYQPPSDAEVTRLRRTNAGHQALVRPIVQIILRKSRVEPPMQLPTEEMLLHSAGLTAGSNDLFGIELPEWFSVLPANEIP